MFVQLTVARKNKCEKNAKKYRSVLTYINFFKIIFVKFSCENSCNKCYT